MKPFILIILTLGMLDAGIFLLRHHPLLALPILLAALWLVTKFLAHPDVRA